MSSFLFLPCYRWVLEKSLEEHVAELKKLAFEKTVVLLDYQINDDVANLSKPLSHAALIQRFIQGNWPG